MVSARVASDPCVGIFIYFFSVKRCPIPAKICWIDWNSAVLSFKRLFSYTVSRISLLASKKDGRRKSASPHRFWSDRWPETDDFFGLRVTSTLPCVNKQMFAHVYAWFKMHLCAKLTEIKAIVVMGIHVFVYRASTIPKVISLILIHNY